MERSNVDDSGLPPDSAPGSEVDPARGSSKTPSAKSKTPPKTPAEGAKVTPLDEDKNIEEGIEIKET
jgi:hypothetical protein